MAEVELRPILEENDFTVTLYSPNNLGNTLSRNEIEGVLIDAGISTPPNDNNNFYIVDANDRHFTISYDKIKNAYRYLKLKVV